MRPWVEGSSAVSCVFRQGGRRGSHAFLVVLGSLLLQGVCPEHVVGEEPVIVFASRVFTEAPDPSTRLLPVEQSQRGRLIKRMPEGQERVLVDGRNPYFPDFTPVDVADPSVSYDGRTIVFSGYSRQDDAWRIYEVYHNGTGLRQITRSDREIDLSRYGAAASFFESYDDVDPCYLPDGRICFVSTRYPGYAPNGRLRGTNLYVVNRDGSDVHRITTERFGADTPAVDPLTGRIVFSRWWMTARESTPLPTSGIVPFSSEVLRGISDAEFSGLNTWILGSVKPDGSGLRMFTGTGLNRVLTIAYRPSFVATGEALWMFIMESPLLGFPGSNGVRLSLPGANVPVPIGGPQNSAGGNTPPRPYYSPPEEPPGPPPSFLFGSAEPLPDGRLLVTGFVQGETPQYDVYIKRDFIGSTLPDRLFGRADRWELDAVPLVPRSLPPVIEDEAVLLVNDEAPRTLDEARETGGTFLFVVENIHFNAPVDVPIALAPPVGTDLTIEFYMNPQRRGAGRPEPPILVDSQKVPADGRIEMELPSGVPLFEVLRRGDGKIAVGRDGQVFHVGGMNYGVSGVGGSCVGCHAGHSMIEVPEDPSWTNIASSALVSASSAASGRSGDGTTAEFSPELLVDRRTTGNVTEWAARAQDDAPTVSLRWRKPVHVREITLYPIQPGAIRGVSRGLTITNWRVVTSLGGEIQEDRPENPPLQEGGTTVELDGEVAFDALQIDFLFDREVDGGLRAALSEIEVIGRSSSRPVAVIRRGDVNCDAQFNLSDPVALLNGLFETPDELCCEVSADANLDQTLDISDAVYLLRWLYLDGSPPAYPQASCGQVDTEVLGCEKEVCP